MFSQSIYNYLQDRELAIQPLSFDFMQKCKDITPRMRYILVNWIVQVHQNYKMQPETLYLAIALMDRYLQNAGVSISKDKFQLVGITALFIASKFEEMFPPEIDDFSSVTESTYSKKEIRHCEQIILQSVDFFLSIPLPIMFLRRLSRALDADRQLHNIAKYLLELTIQEYELCHLPGNLKATVAICLARALHLHTCDLGQAWQNSLSFLSGYTLEEITEPIRILAKAAYRQNSPSKFRAIFDKYRLDDFYDRVAALPQLRSQIMENIACLKFDDEDDIEAKVR
ncbi:unnamed protein product [Protopolystoma xenopodis]|uniref:Uncharacterized protein n=1 Tax=Protopolystoma xenopodis TaxID=117903 RepID=A0A448WTF8_9PLAT|nr:unnamed protein product [Protopolystoma xenopodis]